MVRLFVTVDNHFGKKYDRYPDVKKVAEILKESCTLIQEFQWL